MGKLTLHVQQNTTPERVVSIINFLAQSKTDIQELSTQCNLGESTLEKVIFPFLRSISILTSKKNSLELTALGKAAVGICDAKPELLGEFLHLLIYNLHNQDKSKGFSWAYATIVQQLWLRQEVLLSSTEKNSLVGELIETASEKFQLQKSEIAFSSASIGGVINWLGSLKPSVLEEQGKSPRFSRRYFCAAPILLKAVDAIYRQEDRTYGSKILLRENIQEHLCQMLLLDPSGLDNTLSNAKRTYDYDQGSFFDWGYEGGYGQWVMLTKSPEWTELL